MSTRPCPGGGPRPADLELPPTLLPHAIHRAAPPRARRLSFLASCLVYAGIAVIVSAVPSARVAAQQPVTTPERFVDYTRMPKVDVPLSRPETPRPAAVGTRPADWRPPTEPVDVDTIPETLPTISHAKDSLYSYDMPVGKGDVEVKDPGAFRAPAAAQPGPDTVVDIAYESVRVLHQVAPTYPSLCRHLALQGVVELLITVDPSGVPRRIQTLSAPHPSLEQAAIQAAEQWRFEPARVSGQAVSARFHLTIQFRLTR